MTDDGFNIGVLYAGDRTPYPGPTGQAQSHAGRPRSGVRAMNAATSPDHRQDDRGAHACVEAHAPRRQDETVAAAKAEAPRAPPRSCAPRTLTEFMAQAWLMEIEAAQRYTEFADAMEMHNNREVAAMFRTMAGYETQARRRRSWPRWAGRKSPPLTPRSGDWPGFEAPETAPGDDVHYLMQP